MPFRCLLPSALFVTTWLASAALAGDDRGDLASISPPRPAERHFTFTYSTTVKDVPAGAKAAEVWIPLPHAVRGQKARLVDVVSPVKGDETKESKYGNQMLHFSVPHPAATFTITATYDVLRSETFGAGFRGLGNEPLGDADKSALAPFLAANRLVPVTGKAAEMAAQIIGDEKNTLNAARRLYDYVLAEMRYSKDGQGWGTGSFQWACDSKYGNCTDFHALFISLARSHGIPARFEMGFPIPPQRGEGAVGGYHCWAEFYVPKAGWIPVDISEADKNPSMAQYYFGNLTEDRVSFTYERDLVLEPPQKGEPLNYFIYPYVEVDGTPHKSIDKTFGYKDAPEKQS